LLKKQAIFFFFMLLLLCLKKCTSLTDPFSVAKCGGTCLQSQYLEAEAGI
jgi:hypothetical protein